MNRRRVLRLGAVGTASSLAGCLESFDGLGSDTESSPECDLTPFDQLSRTWPHQEAVTATSPRVTGDGFTAATGLERRVVHELDRSEDSRIPMPWFASADTVCFRLVEDEDPDAFVFFDAGTGDERWRLDRDVESMDTFEPPDGTAGYERANAEARAIAAGLVYVTVTYSGESEHGSGPTLSVGLFALDETDGSIQWSTTIVPGFFQLDSTGRAYVVGSSDALSRAEPAEQSRSDGGWTPDPDTDERFHVQALNARTGDRCWKWDTPRPDGSRDPRPLITDDRVFILFHHLSDEPRTVFENSELFVLEKTTGDELESLEFDSVLRGQPLATDDRLVTISSRPLSDDAETEGGTLFSITPAEDSIDWQRGEESDLSGFPEVATEDTLVLDAEFVEGVDLETGEKLWETESPADVACVVGDTLVTTGDDRTEIQLRDVASGEVFAQPPVDGTLLEGANVIAANDRLFFVEQTEETTRLVARYE